jgi:hypothetical protein
LTSLQFATQPEVYPIGLIARSQEKSDQLSDQQTEMQEKWQMCDCSKVKKEKELRLLATP